MKNIVEKILFATLCLIPLGCGNKPSFYDSSLRQTTDIHHILIDTLNNYLKNNCWIVTDEDKHVTCRPIIYICFQHIDNKKYVSFAMSPHILINTSFTNVTYCKNVNNEFLFCILVDEKDSTNTMFIKNYPFELFDTLFNSYYNNPCFYDGRIFLRSYEIANKKGGGDTLLLLTQPLTKWVCNPPISKY